MINKIKTISKRIDIEKERVGYYLEKDLKKKVDKLAKKYNRSASDIVGEILEDSVKLLEEEKVKAGG